MFVEGKWLVYRMQDLFIIYSETTTLLCQMVSCIGTAIKYASIQLNLGHRTCLCLIFPQTDEISLISVQLDNNKKISQDSITANTNSQLINLFIERKSALSLIAVF